MFYIKLWLQKQPPALHQLFHVLGSNPQPFKRDNWPFHSRPLLPVRRLSFRQWIHLIVQLHMMVMSFLNVNELFLSLTAACGLWFCHWRWICLFTELSSGSLAAGICFCWRTKVCKGCWDKKLLNWKRNITNGIKHAHIQVFKQQIEIFISWKPFGWNPEHTSSFYWIFSVLVTEILSFYNNHGLAYIQSVFCKGRSDLFFQKSPLVKC